MASSLELGPGEQVIHKATVAKLPFYAVAFLLLFVPPFIIWGVLGILVAYMATRSELVVTDRRLIKIVKLPWPGQRRVVDFPAHDIRKVELRPGILRLFNIGDVIVKSDDLLRGFSFPAVSGASLTASKIRELGEKARR